MFNKLKYKNSDKEYPLNMGINWTNEEEKLLLEELNENMELELIAKNHLRTIGGIKSRIRDIAFTMYRNNSSIEEIILKTKLNEKEINKTIKKRINFTELNKGLSIENKNINEDIKNNSKIESDINEIKNDIKELKNSINELVKILLEKK
jgi:hypothetical protein